jgi:hypothetical protein
MHLRERSESIAHAPTVDEVDRISVIADPVIRNLQITQCYWELSSAMARLVRSGANWCTFATWASRQAGSTIRHEDLARAFEGFAGRSPEIAGLLETAISAGSILVEERDVVALRETLRRILKPGAAFRRAGDAVARGNQKVFEEIGREFARYLATFASDTALDADKTARFCASLRPGEPPGGQRLLSDAFTAYSQARFHPDAKTKTELTFLANILIGLHEQTRLQPEIAQALNAPSGVVEELKPRILGLLLPSLWLRLRRTVARLLGRKLPLDGAIDRLAGCVQDQVRQVTTGSVMVLRVSGEVVPLGSDVQAEFPQTLKAITNARVNEVLRRIDATRDSLADSGATDWSDFEQRMHFIVDFFRAWHERPTLFDAPFSPDQTAVLKAGRLPAGPL